MTDTDNRRWLYDQAKKKGVDVGEYEAFDKAMDDANNRKWVYDQATKKGLDLGDYDAYDKAIGPAVAPDIAPTTPQPSVDIKAAPESTAVGGKTIVEPVDTAAMQPAPQKTEAELLSDRMRKSNASLLKGQSADQRLASFAGLDVDNGYVSPIEVPEIKLGKEEEKTSFDYNSLSDEEKMMADSIAMQQAKARLAGAKERRDENGKTPEGRSIINQTEKRIKELQARLDMNPIYRQGMNDVKDHLHQKYSELADLAAEHQEQTSSFIPYSLESSGVPPEYTERVDPDGMRYRTAMRFYQDAEKVVGSPLKYYKDGKKNGVAKGSEDILSDPDFWTMGLTEIGDLSQLYAVFKKIEENIPEDASTEFYAQNGDLPFLNDSEKALVDAYFDFQQAKMLRADNMSIGYNAGQIGVQAIPFMVQMAMGAGAAKTAVSKVSKLLVEKTGLKLLTKLGAGRAIASTVGNNFLGKTLQWGANKVGQAAVSALAQPFMPGFYGAVANRMTSFDKDGRLMATGKALKEGYIDNFLETFTEQGSVAFDGLRALAKTMPIDKIAKNMLGTEASKFFRSMSKGLGSKTLAMGYFDGVIPETFEEFDNAVYSYLRGNPDAIRDFVQVDNLLQLTAAFSGMALFGAAADAASTASVNYDYSQKENELRKILEGRGYKKEQVDFIIDTANNATMEDLSSLLANVVTDSYSQQAVGGATYGVLSAKDKNTELVKAVVGFMRATMARTAMDGINQGQQDQQIEQEKELVMQELGGHKFWQTTNAQSGEFDGSVAETIAFAPIHANPGAGLNEGDFVYLTSEPNPVTGEMGYVTNDGRTGFIKMDDIISMPDNNGVSVPAIQRQPLRTYLSYKVMMRKAEAEQEKLSEQLEPQVEQIAGQYQEGDTVSIDGKEGTISAKTGEGIVVDFYNEDGELVGAKPYSWEEVAQKQNTPLSVTTEEEKVAEKLGEHQAKEDRTAAVSRIVRDNADRFTTIDENGNAYVVDDANPIVPDTLNEDGTVQIRLVGPEGTSMNISVNLNDLKREQPAAEQEPQYEIPRLNNGEIDYDKLMEENPAEFARVNDEESQDGGASTQTLFKNRIAELQKELKQNQENLAKQSKPSEMKKYQRKVADIQGKIANLQSVLDSYNVASAEVETPAAPAPVAPSPAPAPKPAARVPKRKAKRYQALLDQLGDPLDFEDMVMRLIAGDSIRFKWKSNGNRRGLEDLFGGQMAEQRRRINILSNDGGLYLDAAVEELLQAYAEERGVDVDQLEIDAMDAVGIVEDVLRGYSVKDMVDTIQRRHEEAKYNPMEDEDYVQGLLEAEAEKYGMDVDEYNDFAAEASRLGVGTDELFDRELQEDVTELYLNYPTPPTDEEWAEINNQFADEYIARQVAAGEESELEAINSQESEVSVDTGEDGGQEVGEPAETGDAVLPGEQPANGGIRASSEVEQPGGQSESGDQNGDGVPVGSVRGTEAEVEKPAAPVSAKDITTKDEAQAYFEGLYGKGKKADNATRVWELTHKKPNKKKDTGDGMQAMAFNEGDTGLTDAEASELQQLGIQLAVDYITEDGFVKFPAFFKNLVETFGDGIRPFAKAIYLGASADVSDEIAEQMDDRKTVRAFDTNIDINDIDNEQESDTGVSGDLDGGTSETVSDNPEGEVPGGEGEVSEPEDNGGTAESAGGNSESDEVPAEDVEGGLFGEDSGNTESVPAEGGRGRGSRRGSRVRGESSGGGKGGVSSGEGRGTRGRSGGNSTGEQEPGVGRESVDPEKAAAEAEQKAYESEKERIKDETDTDKLKSLKDELKSKISAIEDKFDIPKAKMSGQLRAVIERLRDLFSKSASKSEALAQEKVPYAPASDPENIHSFGSVVPSGSADAMRDAIKRMEEDEGKSVADFVRDELGYKSLDEMFSADGKDTGLSSEQVDSVGLAIHQMKKGKMFIVGDMTGVGKGRQGAAIIRWAKRQGKKVLFVTEKPDLFSDMYQDLKDIGTTDLLPFIVNSEGKANITDKGSNEVILRHPSPAVANELYKSDSDELPSVARGNGKGKKYDFVMMTYSQAQGARTKNAQQKLDWIKKYAKDAIVICDESHNASGESNRGKYFRDLISDAQGVTFMSATFAKRPDNMLLYAIRSTMGDAQLTREDLIKAIEDYGIPMQEILASNLFKTGEMVRRERDFTDVKTHWLQPKEIYSDEEFNQGRATFDKTIGVVNEIIEFQRSVVAPIIKEKNEELEDKNKVADAMLMAGEEATFREYSITSYSGQVSNVANLMFYAIKAQKAADMAIEAIKRGEKPVIAVENTLESYLKEIQGETDAADFSFILNRGLATSLKYRYKETVKKLNPKTGEVEIIKEKCRVTDMGSIEPEIGEYGQSSLSGVRESINAYSQDKTVMPLMLSPLDYIKTKIAEAGYKCDEITGRSLQLVQDGETKKYHTEPFKADKKKAIRLFNGGDAKKPLPKEEITDALILNTAGSTGISLHASRRFGDQRKRTMIILQPARDPNTEVQIRGRVDRTGQVSRAEYFYVTSPIPAEQKVIMMLRQKLASLDANSVGTENVSSNRVDADDMDNKYGDEVARTFLIDHPEINQQLDRPIVERKGEYEHREGLLYELLIGIQRMTCAEQEMILDELQGAYKEQIDYLNQNGINDLATTTMNLEAVTIDSGIFIKGKDNEAASEFAHDTMIERVEANVLRKPLRSADIYSKMRKLGDIIKEDGTIDTEYGSRINTAVAEFLNNSLTARKEKHSEAEKKLEEEIRERTPQKEGQSDEDYEKEIANNPSLEELKSKNKEDEKRVDADYDKQRRAVFNTVRYLKPGTPVFVPLTDNISGDFSTSFGRVIGYSVPKDGNPKKIKVVIAVKDSRASIEIPVVGKNDVIQAIVNTTFGGGSGLGSNLREIGGPSWDSSITDEMRRSARDEWWDKMIPKNTSRQIRYMVTGNILQACGHLGKYKGTITTFTRKDKDTGEITVEKGMLLAEDFDPENFQVRSAVKKEEIWEGYDNIYDSVTKITVGREGDKMVVRFERQGKEKLSSHPILKDEEFKKLVVGEDIEAWSRDQLRAYVAEENVEAALDHLYKQYGFTKQHLFIMPDSTERVDAIVYTDKPYKEVIDELGPKLGIKYGFQVDDKLKAALRQYKMDVNNEELKQRIHDLVQLRQAYLRERYANDESSRLAWKVIIYDQDIESNKDNKQMRDYAFAVREAIKEELAARGVHGNAMHFESGNIGLDKIIETFNSLNKNATNAEIAKKVFPLVKKLKLDVVMNEKIHNATGGQTAGELVEYNWKYMNAEWITDQMKADTILHELVHTVTSYAKRCVDYGYEHLINQDLVDAVQQLDSIFSAIEHNANFSHNNGDVSYTDYGVTNWFEMLAEIGSNELFRDDLRKTILGVKVMSGMFVFSDVTFRTDYTGKTQTAYDAIMERLDSLIDNFSEHGFTEFFRGTQYGQRGYSQLVNPDSLLEDDDTRTQSDIIFSKAMITGKIGIAPNGNKSNLSNEQWAMVRTDAFKNWFGDWENDPEHCSILLDENGEPMVVYHGTRSPQEFYVFDNSKAAATSVGSGELDAYFFSDRRTAEGYAADVAMGTSFVGEGRVIPAFVSLQNPLVVDYDGALFTGVGLEAEVFDYLEDKWVPFRNRANGKDLRFFATESDIIREYRRTHPYAKTLEEGKDYRFTKVQAMPHIAEVVDGADRNQYDGAVIRNIQEVNEAVDDYVAFRPTQIKSATENSGDFDPNNPDIRFSKAERTVDAMREKYPTFDDAFTEFTENGDSYLETNDLEEAVRIHNLERPDSPLTLEDGTLSEEGWDELVDFMEEAEGRGNKRDEAAIIDKLNETAKALGKEIVVFGKEEHDVFAAMRPDLSDAAGFFDPKSGKVGVFLDMINTPDEAEAVVVHEVVGHYGLREVLGKERYDKALSTIYSLASPEVMKGIKERQEFYNCDELTAVDEYLAYLAGEGATNNNELSFWEQAKAIIREMFRALGINIGNITEADLNYMIWVSRNNLERRGNDLLLDAENSLARRAMSRMAYASHDLQSSGQKILLSKASKQQTEYAKAAVARQYEKRIAEGGFFGYQFREAMQDSMLSLRDFMLSVAKAEGKKVKYVEDIEGFENAYLAENALSSRTKIEQDVFGKLLMEPFVKEVAALAKTDEEKEQLTNYMMAKHGLERNEKFAERDAISIYRNLYDATVKSVKSDRSLTPEDKADAIAAAEAEFEKHKAEVLAHSDEKYLEFREKDYSGLTALTEKDNVAEAEEEAVKMVEDYENGHDVDALWEAKNKVTDAILTKMQETGMLTRDAMKDIKDMFQYYIPLRGFEETTSDEEYAYLDDSHGPLNSPILRAEGRKSKADDPISTLANMADVAIMQGNRNDMKQKFLNFVLNHPSDLVSVNDLWIQFNDVTGEWEAVFAPLEEHDSPEQIAQKVEAFEEQMKALAAQEPDKYKKAKDAKNIPYRVINGHLKEHQILVKRLGKTYVLTVNGNPRLAQALNGETNPDATQKGVLGAVGRIAKTTTTTLSQFYTTRNPEFIASNFCRDMLYANTMVAVKENGKYARAFHKNFVRVNPGRMVGLLRKFESQSLDMNDPLEKAFQEFMMNGGETGYTTIKDIEKQKKEIAKQIKKMQGQNAAEVAWEALGDTMDLLNRAVENCCRFAAFITSREQGRSLERSIYDAKEITVNFNKKGAGDKFFRQTGQSWWGNTGSFISGAGREFYAFWNAGLQGTTNFLRAAKRNPVKFGFGAAATFVLGGLMPVVAEYLYGGDDDDDKNSYYNLPEYTRRSNICFRAGERWITIPLPIELRGIYGLGELAMGQMLGKENYDAQELTYNTLSQVSQMMPLDMLEGGGGLHALIPTGIKPAAEAYTNRKWTGLPMYQQKNQWNEDMPEWTRAFKSANRQLVELTAAINGATAEYGDKYEKGFINLNPARIEYMLNGYFGGYATTAQTLVKMAEMATGDRDFDWNNVLIARRFVKAGDETTEYRKLNNEYYDLRDEYEHTKKQHKRYEDNDDTERLNRLENSDKYMRYEIFDAYFPQIDKLNRDANHAEDEDEAEQLNKDKFDIIRDMVREIHETERKRKSKD